MVYDCGSGRGLRARPSLRSSIDKFVEDQCDQPIDLLSISHFDYDHINGLDYFARSCRRAGVPVNRIWAPLLPLADRIVLALQVPTSSRVRSSLVQVILDPEGALPSLLPDAEVELFPPSEESIPLQPEVVLTEGGDESEGESDLQVGPPSLGPGLVMATTRLAVPEEVWETRPYVTAQTGRAALVVEPLVRKFLNKPLGQCTPADLHSIWRNSLVKNFKQAIATELRASGAPTVRGKGGATAHNHSSLCLFSGPTDPHSWFHNRPVSWIYSRSTSPTVWRGRVAPGWVGTGDAPLSTRPHVDALVARFGAPRLAQVGVASVPHHGSKFDSGPALWSALPAVRYATIEADNAVAAPGGNAHPHQSVVTDLSLAGIQSNVTTQNCEFVWIANGYR